MNVKIQCACGTKFAFEVEPVNGRMPMNINCPGCNAGALDLANAEIARQLAPTPASPAARITVPPATIRVAAPAAPPPQTTPPPVGVPRVSGGALRISKPPSSHAPAPAASPDSGEPAQTAALVSAEGAPSLCPRHKNEPALETCRVCGKPICPKCMEQFGYVCSVICRQQAARRQIEVPVYAHQKSVVTARSSMMARRMIYASIAMVVLLTGLWIWYTWFARNPKVVYSIAIAKPNYELGDKPAFLPEDFYQLIGPGRLLSIKNKRLAVFDVAQQKELWSVPLKAGADAPAKTPPMKTVKNGAGANLVDWEALYAEDYLWANPRVFATPSDLWVSFPNSRRLDRFDPQTGAVKEVPIKNKILRVTSADNTLLVISGTDTPQTLTEINLPDGTIQSEDIAANQPAPETKSVQPAAKPGKPALSKPKNVPAAPALAALSEEPDADFSYQATPDFVAAGPNVVQFNTKLLEHKVIAHEAMKPKGKSILESGNLTAGQSLDATQELLNDQQRERTGGKEEEDVSRYQVTLHRLLAKGIPDWTGEVIGPPEFIPLKTVDLVAAGNSLFVFEKENKKKWEAKLTYRVPSRYSSEEGESAGAPWLETKDALYFADQGILTRFDIANGNVRWRLNSVGVSSIQADQRGKLYVTSTTAGPESIKYSQQINIYNKILPVLMKVDPESGQVLWKVTDTGDECLLSGKFVYATRTWQSIAALRLEDGPDTHFDFTLFSPSSGKEIWNYRRSNRRVIRADVQNNWILLHFSDEVRVLKFFSL
jgi:hypothetical protein